LKNAITKKIRKIIIATTTHAHLASALLSVENAQSAKTAQIAKTIS